MEILIVGTGALASLFAARLTASGQHITMLGSWPAGLAALRQNGVRLVDAEGRQQSFPVHATDRPLDCRDIGTCLVLVKSWQTERAAVQLGACLPAGGLAITLQNGLGNREILAGKLGPQRVALGATTTGATLLGPGLVRAGGDGTISIEAHPGLGLDGEKSTGGIVEALRSANFKVEVVRDALQVVWGKLIINAAINPLTALLRVPNGELLKHPQSRALMRALAEEAAAVAAAEKVNPPFGDAAAAAEDVARKTAANHSSMLQDITRGAPTEIDAICGAVARTGRQHHIATPVNEACWQLVGAMVQVSGNEHGMKT